MINCIKLSVYGEKSKHRIITTSEFLYNRHGKVKTIDELGHDIWHLAQHVMPSNKYYKFELLCSSDDFSDKEAKNLINMLQRQINNREKKYKD